MTDVEFIRATRVKIRATKRENNPGARTLAIVRDMNGISFTTGQAEQCSSSNRRIVRRNVT